MSPAPARRLAPLPLMLVLACGAEAPPPEPPGMRLLARVEARLEQERAALLPRLSHYALVFPVTQDELAAFLRQIRVHGAGSDLALGTEFALESHGGGLLRLLFDLWRPEGRVPRPGDRYPFQASAHPPSLGDLYAAGRGQLFLPVPGLAPEAAGERLPDAPQLPRMRVRFGLPGGPVRSVESDAYKLLSLLVERESDPARGWRNPSGQRLSLALLMRHVREHYLASGASFAEPPDHSNLHLVELLVAFASAHPAPALDAVKEHFLAVELAQEAFDPREGSYVLAHYVESLGRLLEAPLRFSEEEKRRVRAWLAELEERRFPDVTEEPLETLCHLARGLRAVSARRAVLE
jgi:hypothetical protein